MLHHDRSGLHASPWQNKMTHLACWLHHDRIQWQTRLACFTMTEYNDRPGLHTSPWQNIMKHLACRLHQHRNIWIHSFLLQWSADCHLTAIWLLYLTASYCWFSTHTKHPNIPDDLILHLQSFQVTFAAVVVKHILSDIVTSPHLLDLRDKNSFYLINNMNKDICTPRNSQAVTYR